MRSFLVPEPLDKRLVPAEAALAPDAVDSTPITSSPKATSAYSLRRLLTLDNMLCKSTLVATLVPVKLLPLHTPLRRARNLEFFIVFHRISMRVSAVLLSGIRDFKFDGPRPSPTRKANARRRTKQVKGELRLDEAESDDADMQQPTTK